MRTASDPRLAQFAPPSEPPPSEDEGPLFAALILGFYLATFLPYLLPTDEQPKIYHDGKTPEQILQDRHTMNIFRSTHIEMADMDWFLSSKEISISKSA